MCKYSLEHGQVVTCRLFAETIAVGDKLVFVDNGQSPGSEEEFKDCILKLKEVYVVAGKKKSSGIDNEDDEREPCYKLQVSGRWWCPIRFRRANEDKKEDSPDNE